MITLPPEILEGGIDGDRGAAERTRRCASQLEAAFANPRFPIETMRLASLPHDEYRQFEGMTLAGRRPRPPSRSLVDFTCDLLVATNLAAGCVIRHFAARQESDTLKLMKHQTSLDRGPSCASDRCRLRHCACVTVWTAARQSPKLLRSAEAERRKRCKNLRRRPPAPVRTVRSVRSVRNVAGGRQRSRRKGKPRPNLAARTSPPNFGG